MRLKVTEAPFFGKEVYHIRSIELCKKFANECKAFNANEAECFWDIHRENTCFRLRKDRVNGRVYIRYSPLEFYVMEGAIVIEYKPLQRSE